MRLRKADYYAGAHVDRPEVPRRHALGRGDAAGRHAGHDDLPARAGEALGEAPEGPPHDPAGGHGVLRLRRRGEPHRLALRRPRTVEGALLDARQAERRASASRRCISPARTRRATAAACTSRSTTSPTRRRQHNEACTRNANVKDNVVVITGASKGIGAELARAAGRAAARSWRSPRATCRSSRRWPSDCRASGREGDHGAADVARRDATARRSWPRRALAFGRIDTLVNNAGATMWARFEDIEDMSILERIMQVNYMGAVYCTHHALPLPARCARAASSASRASPARTGVPTRTGYAASKHAMTRLLRFAAHRARRLAASRVTMIYPGLRLHRHPRERHRPRRQAHPGEPGEGRRGDGRGGVRAASSCGAIEARKREVIMTARGKIGLWLKLVAPALIDRHREARHRNGTLMDLSVWLTYFLATIVLSVTPGPGVFSSISQRPAPRRAAWARGTRSACRWPTDPRGRGGRRAWAPSCSPPRRSSPR